MTPSPLAMCTNNSLNSRSPQPNSDVKPKGSPLRVETSKHNTAVAHNGSSSPFQTDIVSDLGQENRPPPGQSYSPSKKRHTSRTRSPMFDIHMDDTATLPPLPPFNVSPGKLQSSQGSLGHVSPSAVPLPPSSPFKIDVDDNTTQRIHCDDDADNRSILSDDTGFSNFSAVPNADMTLFSKLGNRTPGKSGRSPSKHHDQMSVDQTPSHYVFMTPATSKRKANNLPSRTTSPTPRANHTVSRDANETTSLLLDFTQQFEHTSRGRNSPTKSISGPNLLNYIQNQRMPSPDKAGPRTPGKSNVLNLLDFDLPAQPTPRSIPTITVRELESLKSSYLSEISSLKASLSGREAEVTSLKKAVGDAERRVGEALETVRDEKSKREHAEVQKDVWEKKGREVETLLKNVREEFLAGEKERDELQQKLDEAVRARDEAQLRAAESNKANIAQSEVGSSGRSSQGSRSGAVEAQVAAQVAAQLDEKMENLARELHAVYKKKHEAKVGTLKKTYELRADKRCAELQRQIDDLAKQNEDLQASKESSLSMELPGKGASADDKRALQEQKAMIAGLDQEMNSLRAAQASLLKDLEKERIEKGELVAAVDEMLALQSDVGAPTAVEDFRRSIGRPPSGLSRPGFAAMGGSGLARPGQHGQAQRSVSGGSGKSRMMSNIERMGGARA